MRIKFLATCLYPVISFYICSCYLHAPSSTNNFFPIQKIIEEENQKHEMHCKKIAIMKQEKKACSCILSLCSSSMCFHVFDFTILYFFIQQINFFFLVSSFLQELMENKERKDRYVYVQVHGELMRIIAVCFESYEMTRLEFKKQKQSFMYIQIYSVEKEERHSLFIFFKNIFFFFFSFAFK